MMDIKPKIDLTKFTAQELKADADAWHAAAGKEPFVGVISNLDMRPNTNPNSDGLANPYGTGNHHRISWRRQWDVDLEKMTAKHKPTGFEMFFNPEVGGGFTAMIWSEMPTFGPDSTLAMAQMFGLRELLKDGWEIFHQVMEKQTNNQH